MSINSDDLVSLDGGDGDLSGNPFLKAPLSPLSSEPPFVSPTSPGGTLSYPVNAVHMHVQENAKVPTFLQSIDRSNSSRPSFAASPKMESTMEDPIPTSMAELFLNKESSHRRSLDQNYESLGNFFSEEAFDEKRQPSLLAPDTAQIELDSLTTNIDPTPWSEIERKLSDDEEKVNGETTNTLPPPSHSHSNYYPYGRHQPLPIPQIATAANQHTANASVDNNSPDTSNMAQAIATAAAIASTQTVTARPTNAQSTTSIQPSPYTKAQQTTPLPTTNGTNSSRPYQRQRAAHVPPPKHSVAHAANRASVIAAAKKKSQYGFGGNHSVPSVPAPPPVSNNGRFNGIGNSKTVMPTLPRGHIPPPNSGAAYERKKQRAKDARVKLNEAIERLSIAMSLAGSQSKQRNEFLKFRMTKTEERTKSLQTSIECYKLAEQAKKWDRPSFVGTAASMIQELNSQCESLMRELVAMHENLNVATQGKGTTSLTSHPEHKRQEPPSSSLNGPTTHDSKRIKAGETKHMTITNNSGEVNRSDAALDEKSIYKSVRDFLDPISLVRCSSVSKGWTEMKTFDDNETWLNLAVKRFGFYNVRQWTERLEDTEDNEGTKISKKDLYRSMNAANVMPHMKQDNMTLLGDGKIPGRVSGWVYMVERSNGETLRSVKAEPNELGQARGLYHSQPVVELRIIIQNIGMGNQPVLIRNQQVSVDVSTRRTGGELKEIGWDERFAKVAKTIDGKVLECPAEESKFDINKDICHLRLFETVVLEVYINARGCSTTSKFQQRSNFTKLLVCLEGTTVPMVIPFLRDINH